MQTTENKLFFSSDLHFGHRNILKYCNRPFKDLEEMEEKLIENHNKVVSKKDTIYLLGDISFTSNTKTRAILDKMNGKKHWILGNHDLRRKPIYDMFETVNHYLELKKEKIILFHYPIASWNGMARGTIHLHGHSHGNLSPIYDRNGKEVVMRKMDVGVDCTDYKPIGLDEVIEHFKDIDIVSMDHHYKGSE